MMNYFAYTMWRVLTVYWFVALFLHKTLSFSSLKWATCHIAVFVLIIFLSLAQLMLQHSWALGVTEVSVSITRCVLVQDSRTLLFLVVGWFKSGSVLSVPFGELEGHERVISLSYILKLIHVSHPFLSMERSQIGSGEFDLVICFSLILVLCFIIVLVTNSKDIFVQLAGVLHSWFVVKWARIVASVSHHSFAHANVFIKLIEHWFLFLFGVKVDLGWFMPVSTWDLPLLAIVARSSILRLLPIRIPLTVPAHFIVSVGVIAIVRIVLLIFVYSVDAILPLLFLLILSFRKLHNLLLHDWIPIGFWPAHVNLRPILIDLWTI